VKRFGSQAAVNDLSLEINDKEFMVLLGPSGCGKTTTLRCVAGLETPDSGQICIGDTEVTDLPPKDRDIAMVFQSYALYPHMTVFDNMAFPLKMRKTPKEEIQRRVKETAELLRLQHLLDRKPKQVSGGEAQRVALGRAIVRHPKVFLFDEPLSNLDAKLRVYMRAELKRLQKELTTTTVYVTHDQVEAMTMADRIALMDSGVLQQLSSPTEVYNNPANLFTAGFIGSPPMNFFDCSLTEPNGEYVLDAGEFKYRLDQDTYRMVKDGAASSELIIGVRPEDINVQITNGKETIEAEVYVVEPLGSENVVDVKIGSSLVKALAPPSLALDIGQKVCLELNKEKTHVFDKKTGKTIL
jgi:multiple sugar transport system ATP-binding protein